MLIPSFKQLCLGSILILSLLFSAQQYMVNKEIALKNIKQVFVVTKGSSYKKVITELEQGGILKANLWLHSYVYLQGWQSKIQVGEYNFKPGIKIKKLVRQLVEGKVLERPFSITAGTKVDDLLTKLANTPDLIHSLKGKTKAEIKKLLGIRAESLEGMFLAETYYFNRQTKDIDILRKAHFLLQQNLESAWAKRIEPLPLASAYDALTLASIVEKETGLAVERPEIAGVFVQRLEKNMRLQTDPTVIYAMSKKYKGNIRKKDLRQPSPYNTYLIKGLPPTPIALVGVEAINAALMPKRTKALYFVAKGDGSHYFSATLDEHNRAVRRYQINPVKNYRSTPNE